MIDKLKIDPDFAKAIPPLTKEEFQQLEANILTEGEIYTPIYTWNGFIVDGHNRYRILQKYPYIKYRVSEKQFENRYAVLLWIFNNQLGRRNLTERQKSAIYGRRYEAERKAHGGSERFSSKKSMNLQVFI